MNSLVIANGISFVAAIFTCLSCWVKEEDRIYYLQVGQCLCLSVASFFFASYAGIVTLLLCALRNFLLGKKIYGIKICVSLAFAMLVFGILVNNMGPVGYIVIAANVIYTLGAYFAKRELTIKLNIIFDLLLWIIYEILIIDIPSLISDVIAIAIAVVAIIRHRN